ncbi:E3 ubiquitin-protein ligase RNF169 isoform X1 [Amia ocellicauda]|uniref:E3 ubiquitin-protein ligase RNF169 isoform X1 n=2 Tax=Amia ocellicauda TaxID=2972642 RepID=UPI0034649441
MAALSSAKSSSGLRPRERAQRSKARPAEAAKEAAATARLLTLEEARCPVCLEIFLEPVTMPCRHSVCLPCFKRTVELSSLCCPLCRLRVSSWARRQARENRLVNTELWEMVLRSHPERCQRRMETREGEAGENEIIFRSPVQLSKPGEIRQEYEKQMKKLEEEKQVGEKASEELIHKILEDDRRQFENQRKKTCLQRTDEQEPVAVGIENNERNKMQPNQKKEDCAMLKPVSHSPCSVYTLHQVPTFVLLLSDTEDEEKKKVRLQRRREGLGPLHLTQEPVVLVLSDSENEEPIGGRTRHLSAFVRRTRSSAACSKRAQNHVVQRSRSCTDTEEGRGKGGCPSRVAAMAKTNVAHSSNAGILLSSENSRSFSAPILIPDRRQSSRLGVGGVLPALGTPSAKQERSISPESNDSISEELNHFKPIVCSPCTPPKRLPDGRVLEPTIVKSTPRNLSHSLQKPTSYEASPTILQKWKQIEMDRLSTKVAASSKGTITSSLPEDFPLARPNPAEGKQSKSCQVAALETKSVQDCRRPAAAQAQAQEKGKALASNKRRLIFEDSSSGDRPARAQTLVVAQPCGAVAAVKPRLQDLGGEQRAEAGGAGKTAPSTASGRERNSQEKKSKESKPCPPKPAEPQESNSSGVVKSRPTSRRGMKRSQKTKHLEEPGRTLKKPRPSSRDDGPPDSDLNCLDGQRQRQEEEDRRLALRLQRQFDMERQRVDRRKGTPDKYLLRSWASLEARLEHSPRRSGRVSRRK